MKFKNDQCNFLFHVQFGNPVFFEPGITRFQDLMQRSYENSKGSDQPEGPARIQKWSRVVRLFENMRLKKKSAPPRRGRRGGGGVGL